MDQKQFAENPLVVDACVFNLSQIGELVAKVTDDFEKSNTDIPWRQLYGLRNRIVHEYEGVNLDLVWQIVNDDIPDRKKKMKKLITIAMTTVLAVSKRASLLPDARLLNMGCLNSIMRDQNFSE